MFVMRIVATPVAHTAPCSSTERRDTLVDELFDWSAFMELSLQETPKQIFPQLGPLRFEKNQVNAFFVGEENHVLGRMRSQVPISIRPRIIFLLNKAEI